MEYERNGEDGGENLYGVGEKMRGREKKVT
jgi:hypothetical protein